MTAIRFVILVVYAKSLLCVGNEKSKRYSVMINKPHAYQQKSSGYDVAPATGD
jgi:hypothetical protein